MKLTMREEYMIKRRRCNLSLKYLSEVLSVSTSMLSYYENNQKNLSVEKERKLRELIDEHYNQ